MAATNRIYIGGIPEETRELDLTDKFSQYGNIQSVIIKRKFAFIV